MDEQVPVVVVGGSLVGLSASVLLAHHQVPHVLVERHRGTAIHPRAASFHQRTLEIFRSVGLQDAVEAAAEREFVQNGAIVAVDSLAGRELASFYRSFNEGVEDLSPVRRLFITQIGLEPVLRRHAAGLGADLRYSTEVTGVTQDETGVTVTTRARDGDEERRIRARYLIAADGAHSPVRRTLGIPMQGRGAFAKCATIYFKADVSSLLRGRNLSVVYVNQPRMLAFFRFSITEDAGFLAVFSTFDEQGGREDLLERELPFDSCAELVRAALGVADDFPVLIENVQPWSASAETAAAFRQGDIFLAGDAAHVMPPTGGFGGNTGVADVHNLVWKMAMVLDGRADPALLDSYDAERRPVAHLTVEQAFRRYVERVDSSLPAEDLAPNLQDTAIELGPVYRSGAVVGASREGASVEAPEQPSGRPGTRLGHAWIRHGGRDLSTLDLVGRDFVLLAGPAGTGWIDAAERSGRLEAHRFADERDVAGLGLTNASAVIVRPDGIVGWRCDESAKDHDAALREALQQLTGRSPAPGAMQQS
ncbi:monooxygenase [Altererythrobacter soli]|uniref:Monooxygenase n=1 Tax=Croceibacterium soli TaxID=1739690 RepID=A0A6I4UQJ4_9SPHN|nr:FAD-dependent monooxygenase [Croceibacterium soli]MXP40736.1 monooxygenase [Croceibacterium soli]